MKEPEILLRLCASCGVPLPLEALEQAIAEAKLPVRVRTQDCMGGCTQPVTLSLQAKGRATCLFHGIDPQADLTDIIATISAYRAAPGGWIENAQACGRLRFCLRGRVPAIDL